MPSNMRTRLLISLAVISLIVISFNTSYPDTTNYVYDGLNRLIRVEYGDGTVIEYNYDETGNRSQVYVRRYTLDINVVGSGTVTKNPDLPIYSAGTNVTLTAVNGSQTFSEWSGDLTGSTNPTVIEMDGNKSVTATFTAGWLQGWTYRKPITLSRASGGVTNYQMRLLVGETSGASGEDVDCNGHCQADFDDLRFTKSDGTTLLDYWIESITGTTPNQLATVWVEFDSIGTSATTFYMYYGKGDASAYSDFDSTFIFGDPFDNATLDTNRWPSTSGTPTYSIDTTNYYLEVTDMGTKTWGSTTTGFLGKDITLPSEYMIDAAYGSGGVRVYIAYTSSALGNIGLHCETSGDSPFSKIRAIDSGVSDYTFTFAVEVTGTQWTAGGLNEPGSYYAKQRKISGNIIMSASSNDSSFSDMVDKADSNTADHFRINVYGLSGYTLNTMRLYAFKVRAYASPEPAWGSWGAEESN